ncbi:MAG: hypothetical protein J2P23_04920 [Microlunatus sp.]|nr:hypothetical protein [Microlunatus sp.]
MATLTFGETTGSTRIELVLRPQPAMSLSAARDAVVVSGRRRAVIGDVFGAQYALAVPFGPSNGLSQPGKCAAGINPSKSITSTTDEDLPAVKHDGMGVFATSLGYRPPSPPV